MYLLLAVFIWIRTTLPRLRADQLMRFAWLFLIPLTLFNILLTGALLLLPLAVNTRLLISGVANWLLALLVIFSFRRLMGLSSKGRIPRWARRSVNIVEATTTPARPQPRGAPELAAGPTKR